jgi:hypothetical protein
VQAKETTPINTQVDAGRIRVRRYRESGNELLMIAVTFDMYEVGISPRIASMGVTTVSKAPFTHPTRKELGVLEYAQYPVATFAV